MVSLTELAVLSFAAYRGTQLAVHDTILDAPRSWVYDWHSRKDTSALRHALVTLISCTYCMGWWASGAALAGYLYATGQWDLTGLAHWFSTGDIHPAPIAVHGLEWSAVAGGQALLNRWDDARTTDAG